jgi:hypothetical protein
VVSFQLSDEKDEKDERGERGDSVIWLFGYCVRSSFGGQALANAIMRLFDYL